LRIFFHSSQTHGTAGGFLPEMNFPGWKYKEGGQRGTGTLFRIEEAPSLSLVFVSIPDNGEQKQNFTNTAAALRYFLTCSYSSAHALSDSF